MVWRARRSRKALKSSRAPVRRRNSANPSTERRAAGSIPSQGPSSRASSTASRFGVKTGHALLAFVMSETSFHSSVNDTSIRSILKTPAPAWRVILLVRLLVILGYVVIEAHALIAGDAEAAATIPLFVMQAGLMTSSSSPTREPATLPRRSEPRPDGVDPHQFGAALPRVAGSALPARTQSPTPSPASKIRKDPYPTPWTSEPRNVTGGYGPTPSVPTVSGGGSLPAEA